MDASTEINKQVIQYADSFRQKSDCSNPQVKNEIWNDFLSENFEHKPTLSLIQYFHINKNDIYYTKGGLAEFDVNSYKLLTDFSAVGDKMENDHILAKATLRDFFARRLNLNDIPKETYKNIINNGTAITVTEDMHKAGRTWGNKNSDIVRNKDIKNLKWTTMADLTNHFVYIARQGNTQNLQDFIESAIVLYLRNKNLCLYN